MPADLPPVGARVRTSRVWSVWRTTECRVCLRSDGPVPDYVWVDPDEIAEVLDGD